MLRPVALLLLVTVGACAGAEDPVGSGPSDVRTAEGLVATVLADGPVAPASVVTVRFANGSENQFYYNPCPRRLERQAGTGWESLGEEFRLCTEEVYLLAAGATDERGTDVPPTLDAGTYRFVFPMVQDGQPGTPVQLVSGPFEVR